MLLVIDVGNTNFVLGLYDGEELVNCWRMTTGGNRTADETGMFIHGLFDAEGVNAKDVEAVIKVYRNQYGRYLQDVLDGKYIDVLHDKKRLEELEK